MFDVITTSILILCIVVIFPCQLLLCFKIRSLMIRLLPPISLFLLTVFFAVRMFTSVGWDGLGYMFLALVTAILFCVCGMAWATFGVVRYMKNKRNKESS